MAAFIILLTLALQEISFFDLQFMKPTNLKANNGKIAPIRLKSKWKTTWKHNPKENSTEILSNEITVLTAYFNIGSFMKGNKNNIYTPQRYMRWMKVFGRIRNKMVIYTDDNNTYELFVSLREKFPEKHTKLFLINRTDLWSFQIRDKISNIYNQPGYPKHYPNTVLPDYSCAMHAKFELLANVIKRNYHKTKYFMWLDIGLFRNLQGSFEFGLSPPKDFNDSTVAYSHVINFEQQEYKKIVYNNKVWVGGACNLGRHDILYTFTQEYLNFVEKSLKMNLMDTDQQIIYGMYVQKQKPETQIQLYRSGWFNLGYICYKTWLEEQNEKENSDE